MSAEQLKEIAAIFTNTEAQHSDDDEDLRYEPLLDGPESDSGSETEDQESDFEPIKRPEGIVDHSGSCVVCHRVPTEKTVRVNDCGHLLCRSCWIDETKKVPLRLKCPGKLRTCKKTAKPEDVTMMFALGSGSFLEMKDGYVTGAEYNEIRSAREKLWIARNESRVCDFADANVDEFEAFHILPRRLAKRRKVEFSHEGTEKFYVKFNE